MEKNKCRYCEFLYETDDELLIHLNKTHIKCGICFETVFNVGEFDDDYAVCRECREEEQ